MDKVVDDFVNRGRWWHEPLNAGRAKMFALQHRLNTRQRNSVLKLKVATNCTDWDTRMNILKACSEEVIADHEHGGGRPHWAILEDLGVRIGLKRKELTEAKPLPSTQQALARGHRRQYLRRARQRTGLRQRRVQEARLVRRRARALAQAVQAERRRARLLRAAHRGGP
jgi:hypothetical protein